VEYADQDGYMKKLVLLIVLVSGVLALNGCMESPVRMGFWEIGMFLLFLPGITLYFLPTIIAAARHKRSMLGIVLLNTLAGWSVIGWVIALVWAFSADN